MPPPQPPAAPEAASPESKSPELGPGAQGASDAAPPASSDLIAGPIAFHSTPLQQVAPHLEQSPCTTWCFLPTASSRESGRCLWGDHLICVTDQDMRHGRKSASILTSDYKVQVLASVLFGFILLTRARSFLSHWVDSHRQGSSFKSSDRINFPLVVRGSVSMAANMCG